MLTIFLTKVIQFFLLKTLTHITFIQKRKFNFSMQLVINPSPFVHDWSWKEKPNSSWRSLQQKIVFPRTITQQKSEIKY